jgi:hypothetical protein
VKMIKLCTPLHDAFVTSKFDFFAYSYEFKYNVKSLVGYLKHLLRPIGS